MRTTKIIIAALAAATSSSAFAANDSATSTVTANIAAACTLSAPATINLDSEDFNAGFTKEGQLTAWCTNGEAVTVSVPGSNSLVGTNVANTIAYSAAITSGATYTSTGATTNPGFTLTFSASNPKADAYTGDLTFSISS